MSETDVSEIRRRHEAPERLCHLTGRRALGGRAIEYVRADLFAAKESELATMQARVNDLQKGMYINCVYCGHRYGPDDKVKATMAEVLKAHIEECPKHPMFALKAELATARERVKVLEIAISPFARAWNRLLDHPAAIPLFRTLSLGDLGRLAQYETSGIDFKNASTSMPELRGALAKEPDNG